MAREMKRVRATYGNAAILDASRTGSPVDAARTGRGAALSLHVRRLHRAVVEHVGRGRGLRGPDDLWRQGRLQDLGPRAVRLRQFQADADVGLEPRRRHFRHRHDAVSEMGQAARHARRLHRPAPHRDQPPARRRAHLHPPRHRRRGADRDGLCHRQRRAARPGLLRPPRTGLRRGRICPRVRRPARRTAPICSASPTAWRRRRNGPPRSPASRPRRSAGWRSSSPPPSRRRCRRATPPAAPSSASSSTAPPMRWRR